MHANCSSNLPMKKYTIPAMLLFIAWLVQAQRKLTPLQDFQ